MQTRRGQSGYGLFEALVSIMLTAFVILGLAGSLLAAIKSSEVADRVQRTDSALGSFTESLKSMDYPEVDPVSGTYSGGSECPELADFSSAWENFPEAWAPPPELGVDKDPVSGQDRLEIVDVEHWQPDGTDMGSYTAACPGAGDPYTHRLTVEVTLGEKSRKAQVVVTRR